MKQFRVAPSDRTVSDTRIPTTPSPSHGHDIPLGVIALTSRGSGPARHGL
ncbi:hypothetical protein P0L94_08895 [Microbacter sp. GSS18]|nr:hypothetical protein P0L94_08895 [Microbacter sp. GSS18]